MMYSVNHPTIGDYQNNACFYVKGEDLMLGPTCQYFIAHVPGFSRDRNTISLESYCKRGYFLRQKRYGFILAATHASLNFGKCSSWIEAITQDFFYFFKSIHQPFCPWIKRFYTRGNKFQCEIDFPMHMENLPWARENELGERVPVPHDNYIKSI